VNSSLGVFREILVGDSSNRRDHQTRRENGANSRNPRCSEHARRKEFEAGCTRLGRQQRLRRREDAGQRDHAAFACSGDDLGIDIRAYHEPAADVMEPLHILCRQNGTRADQDSARGQLDRNLDGAERIRRIEGDLDGRHAKLDQHAHDALGFLRLEAAQDRNQLALHLRERDRVHL